MDNQIKSDQLPTAAAGEVEPFTIDDFLGGALRLRQPRDGYRISMDTVLLAASVQAKPGETVLEGGVGSGGAALCLAHRLPGVKVYGIDMQDHMLAYARQNILENNLSEQVTVEHGSIKDLSCPEATYDHVMINPPYLAAGKAIRPPAETKGLAHMDSTANLKDWIKFCIYQVKNRGTVTIIYRADRMDEVIAHLYRRVGELKIMPLWPRLGSPAKRVIIQGRKGIHGASKLLPGLALHGEQDRYTEEAEAILRKGKSLQL
ncbi:methyltransferase [Kordiimonas sediminis]|uniref:Methyltransferase n=1 Tax=Kordiimonas sediminis TaxID=1735581 RepID=A0A919ATZ9_9PROT|nr:methyltransferase domain-containing protein [Kordiimonas sediminis]GHF23266.1 methyltransferase [Kordiimonas sediminis]